MNNTAVLFIHGFMGHPNEYKILKDFFSDLGYDTYNLTLSGHKEEKVKKVTRKDWERDCVENIEILKSKGYQKIILVGHSMGGVLSIAMAIKYKDYVDKLILIDPAIEYLKMKDGKLQVLSSLRQSINVLPDLKNKLSISPIHKCSLLSVREFCLLVEEHHDDINKIKCPVLFLHGDKDNVVAIDRIKSIYEKLDNQSKEFITINNGSHWFFSYKVEDSVYQQIKDFLLK